jgi:hypothetical protein
VWVGVCWALGVGPGGGGGGGVGMDLSLPGDTMELWTDAV